jgi:hypothetical protein
MSTRGGNTGGNVDANQSSPKSETGDDRSTAGWKGEAKVPPAAAAQGPNVPQRADEEEAEVPHAAAAEVERRRHAELAQARDRRRPFHSRPTKRKPRCRMQRQQRLKRRSQRSSPESEIGDDRSTAS